MTCGVSSMPNGSGLTASLDWPGKLQQTSGPVRRVLRSKPVPLKKNARKSNDLRAS